MAMKKQLRSLVLNRETVRRLESLEPALLKRVEGGATSGDGEFQTHCSFCAPTDWTRPKG
jgi:hypothetical protein